MSPAITPKILFRILIAAFVLSIGVVGFEMRQFLTMVGDRSESISIDKAQLQILEDKSLMTIVTEAQMARLQFIQAIADEVIPAEKTQPELITQLIQIARENNISLESITFNKRTESAAPTQQATTIPDITQAEPLPNIKGVYSLPLTISINGSYDNMLGMLQDIELNRRKMQVSSVAISPVSESSGGGVAATIVIDVYVRP